MISEILEHASKLKTNEEQIDFLRTNNSKALQNILTCVFNPNIKFLLPIDNPKYKSNDNSYGHEKLLFEVRKLYLFVENGKNDLKQERREELFIQFLESIHPSDASMMIMVKNKQLPWKEITSKLIEEAFPDLIPKESNIPVTTPTTSFMRRKLTEEQVREIKKECSARKLNHKEIYKLAEKYSVNETTIRMIRDGKSWIHIN